VVVDPERVEPQIFDCLSPIQEREPIAARTAAVNAEANPLRAFGDSGVGYPRCSEAHTRSLPKPTQHMRREELLIANLVFGDS